MKPYTLPFQANKLDTALTLKTDVGDFHQLKAQNKAMISYVRGCKKTRLIKGALGGLRGGI